MRNRIAIAALVLTCLGFAPAKAQTVGLGAPLAPLSMEEARDTAVANGVVSIRKIEYDEGLWKIYGRDAAGRRVEMKIDPRTGVIAQLDRFD